MRIRTIYLICFLLFFSLLQAQDNSFEGVIDYQTEVRSNRKEYSDATVKKMLSLGTAEKVYIKKGFYFSSFGHRDEYTDPVQKKIFIRFKNIDTLYYIDCGTDTSSLLSVTKSDKGPRLAGHDCKTITLNSTKGTLTYNYSPDFFLDPIYHQDYALGHYNTYVNESRSVFLKSTLQYPIGTVTSTAIRISAQPVDDKMFQIPDLPVVKFEVDRFLKEAQFRSPEAWMAYLRKNLKADLATKVLKVPKGQSSVSQTVIVGFVIKETGEVGQVQVVNRKEVHPALAAEAMRVIMESSGWKPATIYGQKIDFWFQQPITFLVQ